MRVQWGPAGLPGAFKSQPIRELLGLTLDAPNATDLDPQPGVIRSKSMAVPTANPKPD